MSDNARLQLWIEHVFDHPAKGRLWYFDADAPLWPGNGDDVPELMAAFEQGDEVLSALSDEALEQGFWYAIGAALVRAHLSEAGAGALNTSCYMWWLDLNFADHPGDGEGQGNLIEEFLRSNPGVRPELAAYAASARRGCVL